MSLNGVSSCSYNPYAYPTNNPYCQGYYPVNTNENKENNLLATFAKIGTGIAAVGTAAYAVKKGKKINGENSSLLKNLKTGFSEIGKTIYNTITKITKKNEGTGIEKEFTQAAEKINSVNKAPYSATALNNAINDYKNITINKGNEILQEVVNPYGRIATP